ncbi:hypothetical protein H6F95_29115 [Cyanobacteria bacterium FACHB-471]|nr:hypothetical protein [Cyanobacteria bacterium FACHB-471]
MCLAGVCIDDTAIAEPPTNINNPRGMAAAMSTVPKAIPDPVFCSTN